MAKSKMQAGSSPAEQAAQAAGERRRKALTSYIRTNLEAAKDEEGRSYWQDQAVQHGVDLSETPDTTDMKAEDARRRELLMRHVRTNLREAIERGDEDAIRYWKNEASSRGFTAEVQPMIESFARGPM